MRARPSSSRWTCPCAGSGRSSARRGTPTNGWCVRWRRRRSVRSFQELREEFSGLPDVERYLTEVEQDLVAHAEELRGTAEAKPVLPFMPAPGRFLDRYEVNVLVDRHGLSGAPVVLEPNPTYGNLMGRIEHRAHCGTLVTDFSLIRPGALHRANGGYLVLDAVDVLRHPLVWDALKKAVKSTIDTDRGPAGGMADGQ